MLTSGFVVLVVLCSQDTADNHKVWLAKKAEKRLFHIQMEKLGSLVTGASCLSPGSYVRSRSELSHTKRYTKTPMSLVLENY
jgi:hypothetical protein